MSAPLGALRHRLTLDRGSTDAAGELVWTAIATVFAALTPVGAGETVLGAAATGRVTHRIEIRWRDDVTSRDRLRLGDRLFRIVAAQDPDERRRRLVILAEEDGR